MKAVRTVATIWVDCPKCEEPQPNNANGSLQWGPEDVDRVNGKIHCCKCGIALEVRWPR